MKSMGRLVGFLFLFLFSIGLFPAMNDALASANPSTWTFIAHDYVYLLLTYFPYVFAIATLTLLMYTIAEEIH